MAPCVVLGLFSSLRSNNELGPEAKAAIKAAWNNRSDGLVL